MNNIKKLRREKNLTQLQLGKLLGISQQLVWKYENEVCEPSIAVLSRLADICGTSVDYIIGRSEKKDILYVVNEMQIPQKDTQAIIRYLSLEENHRFVFRQMIENYPFKK